MRISVNTRLFALLGDPVSHSLSPRMQNAGFLAAGLDAVYVAMPCSAAQLPTLADTLVASGGGGNITIPHKNAAAALPGVRDERVQALGVANVFGRGVDGGTMLGNSDVDGFLSALDRLEAPATAWHLLGTGGSARAVVGAARERGARIAVRSRAPGRGECSGKADGRKVPHHAPRHQARTGHVPRANHLGESRKQQVGAHRQVRLDNKEEDQDGCHE